MTEKTLWEKRLDERRPVFEVAGFALTTVTWVSLCFVSTILVIRGYSTPAPALEAMGWQGTLIYSIFALPFTAIAILSSLILIVFFWSLIVDLKWDLELGENRRLAFAVSILSNLWHYAFGMFLLVLTMLLSIQILRALE